jgi:hypothetical protein
MFEEEIAGFVRRGDLLCFGLCFGQRSSTLLAPPSGIISISVIPFLPPSFEYCSLYGKTRTQSLFLLC